MIADVSSNPVTAAIDIVAINGAKSAHNIHETAETIANVIKPDIVCIIVFSISMELIFSEFRPVSIVFITSL